MKTLSQIISILVIAISTLSVNAQTNTFNSATTWVVPAGVSSLSITVYGGGGGTGGQDCGAGCTNASAGQVGYIQATYAVSAGDVIGIYPGGKGGDGLNSATGTGGGAGGVDSYPAANYNGGSGGNAGASGSSGGGGGGGAASVLTLNAVIRIVAGGAGGGGGMANQAGSGYNGVNTVSSGGNTYGGNGTTPSGDGGGGAGGGGGQFGSVGSGTHAAGSEQAGNGGFRGNNSVTGATLVTTNSTIAWTVGGRIVITYNVVLPVSYLSFTGYVNQNKVLLNWSTASEQNTSNFIVQRSSNNNDWENIGVVTAAGNSSITTYYSFIDEQPVSGINYYRLSQNDLDANQNFSKTITANFRSTISLIKIFPNPIVNGALNISLSKEVTIYLYSNSGSKLMEKTLTAGQHKIDVSKFAKGNYFIKADKQTEGFIIQ